METTKETIKHVMSVIGINGDSKFMWDPENETEVAAARAQFDALKKKGYLAYKVEGEKGKKGELLREFDPTSGRIIMAPAVAGG
jgi:hypothetical protein